MNTTIIKSVFIILYLFVAGMAFAGPVKISGKAADYAQNSIPLNTLHDFISEEIIKLGDIHFNAQGFFELEVNIDKVSLCFADFDGYHGMIYLEPGKSYELVFPPKRNLTASEKRNPFLKPEPVWFGIRNAQSNDLNVLIQKFESAYLQYENKYFNQIFINQSGASVDTLKRILNKEFPPTGNLFFESHKHYRKGNLEFALHQGKSPAFFSTYFKDDQPVYNLAAYANLFNQAFVNYFSHLENTSHHSDVKTMVNSAKLNLLDEYFQKQLHFNNELAHLVLLKSMKDAYYTKNFSKASILKLLNQVNESNWSALEKKSAQYIHQKLIHLTSGTTPPAISLTDQAGRPVKFSDFPNTYIYLHFTDPANSICRQHLDALKKIEANYKNKIVIINVIPDVKNFKNAAAWAGIFTSTTSNLESTYKVKTVPSSFLISKDGKLLLSPAPNPIDGLDRQFGQILKNDHLKEMQKANAPKNLR